MTLPNTPLGFVRRMVAAILVMAATSAVLVGVSSPATAAACSSSSGVSVVVDFTGVASGLETACVAGGGNQPASDVLSAAGFRLDYVQRQPGFLCRINGVPDSDPCVNTPPSNAYWGLFWSDGKDGVWHYSDFGVSALQVPDGGYIGLAWQSGTRRVPGHAATAHPAAAPSPTPTASEAPTTGPSPTQPSSSGTTSPTQSPKPTGTGSPGPTGTTGTTGTTASGSPTAETTPAAPSESGSPSAEGSGAAAEDSSAAGSPTRSSGAKASAAAGDPVESDSTSAAPASASTEPSADPVTPTAAETESRRVPTWVSLGILVLLLVSIGIAAMAARRRTQP